MKIIDNFLDKTEFKKLQSLFLDKYFPWYLTQVLKKNNELEIVEEYNYQLVHQFYKEFRPWSHNFELLQNLLDKINPTSILKIKANLLFKTETKIKHGFHTDEDCLCTTAILYINSNNGGTEFKDGTFIESKENRFVSFPSNLLHTGTTNTCKQPYRIVLNLNYI